MFFYFETAMHKRQDNKCMSHNHLKLALLDNDARGSIPVYVIILAKETIGTRVMWPLCVPVLK